MKMRSFWCLLFVVSLPADSFREEKKAEEAIGTLGESVTFHRKTSEPFDLISWFKVTKDSVSNIAIVEGGQPCRVKVLLPKFEGRLNVSRDCRSLQITNLHQHDSGEYQGQIKDHDENFRLEIYKSLSESDLEVQCEADTLGGWNYTWQLNCSAGRWGDGVNYSWTSPSKDEKISSQVVQRHFQDGDANYTCTAENPVSKASRTVSIKEACKGNAMDFGNGQLPYEFLGVTIAAVMIVVKVIVNIVFVVSVKCFSGTKPRDTPRRRGESVVFGRSRR